MDMKNIKRVIGFTLLEMLLVLAISSSLILLLVNFTSQKTEQARRDKTVLQVQQIMNAALSFYVNNSRWPITCGTPATWTSISALPVANTFSPGKGYLPPGFGTNVYGQPFQINCGTQAAADGGNFYVATSVGTYRVSNAFMIAGQLPLAYTTTAASLTGATVLPPAQDATCTTGTGPTCTTIVSSVTIPGQNLNNARSVNFAGLYYGGSCVPAPNCPPGMSPSIFVVPASVAGVSDKPTCAGPNTSPYDPVRDNCTANVYPLASFTAFARGGLDSSGVDSGGGPVGPGTNATNPPTGGGNNQPYDCNVTGSLTTASCWQTYTPPTNIPQDGTLYWRVCLAVVTQKGQVAPQKATDYTQWGKMMGQVLAITRCVPNNGSESPSGSQNVYQQNVPDGSGNFVP